MTHTNCRIQLRDVKMPVSEVSDNLNIFDEVLGGLSHNSE